MSDDTGAPKRHADSFGTGASAADKQTPWYQAGRKIYDRVGAGFLIALLGKKGTGKTQIATNLLLSYEMEHGKSAQYVKAMDIYLQLKATFRSVSQESELDVLSRFRRFSFLVIDEFSVMMESPWSDSLIRYLVDERYDAKKDTLIVSNLNEVQFKKSLGDAGVSRLNETGGIIICDWESFRK